MGNATPMLEPSETIVSVFPEPTETKPYLWSFTYHDLDIGLETYVHKIPDSLSSEDAAPLQCAGSTVYSAIVSSTKPGDRVGIIGIGGLGHLAIQFSAKMGFETVVFSTTAKKEAEARSFGASEFYLLSEPEKITTPIDVLLIAGSRYPDWSKSVSRNAVRTL
jgi:D-arabinose 1-dehydrogenase-like Zn-dependent alcohol dehydrogenase